MNTKVMDVVVNVNLIKEVLVRNIHTEVGDAAEVKVRITTVLNVADLNHRKNIEIDPHTLINNTIDVAEANLLTEETHMKIQEKKDTVLVRSLVIRKPIKRKDFLNLIRHETLAQLVIKIWKNKPLKIIKLAEIDLLTLIDIVKVNLLTKEKLNNTAIIMKVLEEKDAVLVKTPVIKVGIISIVEYLQSTNTVILKRKNIKEITVNLQQNKIPNKYMSFCLNFVVIHQYILVF